ncbi:MAG TPA: DUF3341 domain-containing protein [Terriglobales bacterium]|nr:DUF3341 domain-containing protein [Terriglobales bacterium]
MKRNPLYGLLAEFSTPTQLAEATWAARRAGYRRMDAYSPFGIEEVAEALDFHRTSVPLIVLLGGVLGGAGGYLLQYWISVYAYPLNVGGKPLHSWPAFIVVTFETTILGAALAAVFGMLALNRLPQPYHPLFNVPRFAAVTKDKFFLVIESRDPQFSLSETYRFLQTLGPQSISEVPD